MMLRYFAVTLLLLTFGKGGIAKNNLEYLNRAKRQLTPIFGPFVTNKNRIAVLERNSHTGSRIAGDIYIGTTRGVYLKYVGTHDVKRIEGIYEPVAAINIDFNGGAYVTTSLGTLYYIDENGNNTQGLLSYISDRILSIGILKKYSRGSRLPGDVYIGTIKGAYLKYVGTHTIKKIEGISEPVIEIDIDFNGGAYLITQSGKIYYIDENGDNKETYNLVEII